MNLDTLDILENRLTVEHRNFTETKAQVLRCIQHGRSGEPVCVIGPTGIGKTKLQSHLAEYLSQQQAAGWCKGTRPALIVEAPASINGKFPWRPFLEDLLAALGEIDLQGKVDLQKAADNRKQGKRAPPHHLLSIGDLEKLLRTRINILRPAAIFIDECQNLVDNVSDFERKANVNRIKSWANSMETKLLLFGTHEAKNLLNLNEQLARRIDPIYFPRYKRDNKEDVIEFARFYKSILKIAEIPIDKDCHKDFFSIYDYSLGTPGLLIPWLHKSVSFCIDRNLSIITPQILKRVRFSADRLETIEQSIKNFEAYQQSTYADFNPDSVLADEPVIDDMFGTAHIGGPVKGRRKPGTQNPRSYKVHANKF